MEPRKKKSKLVDIEEILKGEEVKDEGEEEEEEEEEEEVKEEVKEEEVKEEEVKGKGGKSVDRYDRHRWDLSSIMIKRMKAHDAIRTNVGRMSKKGTTTRGAFVDYGTREWSDMTFNIIDSKTACRNDCVYCYVKPMNARFGRMTATTDTFHLDMKRVDKVWKPKHPGKLIMFPSTHDLFPEMIEESIDTIKKMIRSGNHVLIVSKPFIVCIRQIVESLKGDVDGDHTIFSGGKRWKDHVTFRFTVSTESEEVSKIWEPRASTVNERLECVRLTSSHGFRTTISMEPYLSDPRAIVRMTLPMVEEIWIGRMNHFRDKWFVEERVNERARLDELYSEEFIRTLVAEFRNEPKIFWKESITKMYLKKPRRS
jgi:hypothetical protein